MKPITPISCSKEARTIFSGIPATSACRALCSKCIAGAKRNLKKSIKVGLSGIAGRRGSSPISILAPGWACCSLAPFGIAKSPSASRKRRDLTAIASFISCIILCSSASARSLDVITSFIALCSLEVFGRADHRPPHMRDRAVVETEALLRLAEIAADHVLELFQFRMHIRVERVDVVHGDLPARHVPFVVPHPLVVGLDIGIGPVFLAERGDVGLRVLVPDRLVGIEAQHLMRADRPGDLLVDTVSYT